MGWTAVRACTVTLLCAQSWQSRHEAVMSRAIPFHTNLLEISLFVAIIPGCAMLCKATKTAFKKVRGTRGRGAPQETSHHICPVPCLTCTSCKQEDWRVACVSGQLPWEIAISARFNLAPWGCVMVAREADPLQKSAGMVGDPWPWAGGDPEGAFSPPERGLEHTSAMFNLASWGCKTAAGEAGANGDPRPYVSGDPEGTFMPPGRGLESASATTLLWPDRCQMSEVNWAK